MRRALESPVAMAAAVVAVLVAALVAGLGVSAYSGARHDATQIRTDRASVREEQQAAVDFATKVLTNLMTIRQDTVKQDVDRITADIGGDFAGQFTPRRDSYESVVELNKIVAEGTVVAAGLENESTDDSGKKQYRVVMAVDQEIRNNAGGAADTAKPGDAATPSSTTAAKPGDAAKPSDTAKPSDSAKPTTSDTAKPSSTTAAKPGDAAKPSDTAKPSDPAKPTTSDTAKPGAQDSKDNADANLPAPGQPEKHTYRIRVTVTPDDTGALKVTGVDFIP